MCLLIFLGISGGCRTFPKYDSNTTIVDYQILESVVDAQKNEKQRTINITIPEQEHFGIKTPGSSLVYCIDYTTYFYLYCTSLIL